MSGLPSSQDSLLVRSDFTDDRAWQAAEAAAVAENGDGFRAYVQIIDEINPDELLDAYGVVDPDRARSLVADWTEYLLEHRDEITAMEA